MPIPYLLARVAVTTRLKSGMLCMLLFLSAVLPHYQNSPLVFFGKEVEQMWWSLEFWEEQNEQLGRPVCLGGYFSCSLCKCLVETINSPSFLNFLMIHVHWEDIVTVILCKLLVAAVNTVLSELFST